MELDLEALRVVSQWQFSPTIVGGTAVAVIVTVTVKFTLQ
jgi:outer membrane biosynthesis protein TonB